MVLCTATPTKAAGIVRTDWEFGHMVPIFTLTLEDDWEEAIVWKSDFWNPDRLFSERSTGINPIWDGGTGVNILTNWTNSTTPYPFFGYAASIEGSADDLALLSIFVNESPADFGDSGMFFYNLEQILLAKSLLDFDFGHPAERVVFTFYGYTAPIPEPATLAVMGLGLAGLAVARRRMKK